ncbi:MAG: hypothetical protein ACE37F_26485 [Nannocystaceae bacterium]|nr:hypothetical protein [bacterium]
MKLANLTRVQGRVLTAFAAAALLLPGCDSDGDDSGTTDTETASSDTPTTENTTDESDTDPAGSTTTDPSESETTDPTDPTEDSTTTGTVPEGFGCDMPVACDKGVYEGSPTVTTQADVEELAGYTEITGRLAIANSELECLNFLSCLTSVGHDLNIFNNDALVDVSGLDNIEIIGAITDGPLMPGGTLTISENESLVDFDSLNLIEQTPISFSISENPSLESISGFQGFVGTQRNFEIRFNENLTNIASDGLREILFIGGECVVTNNPSLCISTIEDMCSVGVKQGPFGGSTVNNDNGC